MFLKLRKEGDEFLRRCRGTQKSSYALWFNALKCTLGDDHFNIKHPAYQN